MKLKTTNLKMLLLALGMMLGANVSWGETLWTTYKSWNFTGLTAAELSGYSKLTNQNGENKTFYINDNPFTVSNTESALYGLTFEGVYDYDKSQVKGGFNTTTASGNRGFILGGGAAKITIPNLKKGMRGTVTTHANEKIASSQLEGIAQPSTGVSVGIVKADGDVTIARSGSTNYVASILVEGAVGETNTATLDHTAGAKWGSNKDVASTVDAEKEGYNNYTVWAGAAYAKFSFEIPSGHVITSAILTYSKIQYNKYTYSDGIHYMSKDFDLDWATFAGQTNTDLRNASYANLILTTDGHKGESSGKEHTGLTADVTSAVKTISAAGQNYIIFQWSANNGSADLYGKGADAAKRPVLTITTRPAILATIDECKTHETSSAFATYIDGLYYGGSLTTDAEVYSALTQWEIDNASGNDITKVIRDAAVSNMTYWNNARPNSNQQYTGAPDNTYFDAWDTEKSDASQTIYGLPAGTYTLTAATRASEALDDVDKYNVWLYDGSENHKVLGNHIGSTGGSLGNGWGRTVIIFTLAAKTNVRLGFYSLPESKLWAGCDDFHLYMGNLSTTATIGSTGYATFSSPYAVDFSGEDGLTVYKAKVNGDKSSVVLTAIGSKEVPANTGVILAGSAKTYTGTVIASADAVTENDLLASTDNPAEINDYILVNEGGTAVFAPMTSGTLATGKAYLPADKCPAVSGGAKSLKIVFDDETLGISDATLRNGNAESMKDNAIYNLSGQRIAAPQKGINIVNGKKIIVK